MSPLPHNPHKPDCRPGDHLTDREAPLSWKPSWGSPNAYRALNGCQESQQARAGSRRQALFLCDAGKAVGRLECPLVLPPSALHGRFYPVANQRLHGPSLQPISGCSGLSHSQSAAARGLFHSQSAAARALTLQPINEAAAAW